VFVIFLLLTPSPRSDPLPSPSLADMLEAIGAGSGRAVGSKDWADIWNDSPQFQEVKRTIAELKEEGLAMPVSEDKSLTNECAFSLSSLPSFPADPLSFFADSSGFVHQLQVVSQRTFTAFWRSPDYGFTYVFSSTSFTPTLISLPSHSRLFNHISIALVVGLTFLNLNDSVASLQYRVFGSSSPLSQVSFQRSHSSPSAAVFFVSVIPAIIMSQIEPMFIMSASPHPPFYCRSEN
jgi:ATP-binding cassette subfamily G (WHITE) protein 2 (SNQ2)